MKKSSVFRVLACVTALGFTAPAVQALTATATFTVSATVPAACSFTATPTNMAFGVYSGAAIDAQNDMSILCSNGTAYKVYATPGVRQMTATPASGSALRYELYSDSARTAVFPSTVGAGVARAGSGSNQALTIYGRVPGSQSVNPGAYGQTVTVNIDF